MKSLLLAVSIMAALSTNAMAVKQTIAISITVNQEKEYTKVEASKISPQVLKELEMKYDGYAITEAFQAKDGEYKIALSKGSTRLTVYYKSNGEFVKEQK